MKGLDNLGNTCYLNAALQCLLHVPSLTNYVLQGWAEKSLLKRRANACALANHYIHLTRAYWTTPEPPVLSTAALHAALGKVHKGFANGQPHDAHEAVLAVLKHLHDAMARTPRIEPSQAAARVHREAWNDHVAKDGYSVLTELFVGQMECTLTCSTSPPSVTHEHFQGLSLDVRGTLADSVAAMLEPVHIEDYAVDGAVQTKRVVYAPLVLTVHLKRQRADGSKVDDPVEYETVMTLLGCTYHLFGICFHRDGHYTAACELDGAWRLMDDDQVRPYEATEDAAKDVYMLFFKKLV